MRFLRLSLAKRILVVAVLVFGTFILVDQLTQTPKQSLSTIMNEAKHHQVAKAEISANSHEVTVTLNSGNQYKSNYPNGYEGALTTQLLSSGTKVETSGESLLGSILVALGSLLPSLLIVFLLMGGPQLMSRMVLNNDNTSLEAEMPTTRFSDVIGMDHVLPPLRQLVDMVKNPQRYHNMGVRITRGYLFYGPPGSGKTHLARAVAGEAGVPLFVMSGSDFVEMFVGVGASRVRNLFKKVREEARKKGAAIIFIDEIESVAASRRDVSTGGNDERNNTLTQMLTEIDGFNRGPENIVVIGATNRPDIIDSALLRAGRLERQVATSAPDLKGRELILRLHAKPMKLAKDVDLAVIAKMTTGMSGADLATLTNEAGLVALREDATEVTLKHFKEALAITIMGPARENVVMADAEKRTVAAHEAGHAVVAYFHPNSVNKPHRVTIIPRGESGGSTWFLGEEHKLQTSKELQGELAAKLGGRAGEERVLGGDFTSGPAHDIVKATEVATKMVFELGMGMFTAGIMADGPNSQDGELDVDRLVREALETARQTIEKHKNKFDALVAELIERETIEAEELEELLTA